MSFFYILKFVIQLFKDIYCITVKIQQGDYVYLLWKLIINSIFKMFLTNSHHHFLEVVDWLLINTTLSNLSSVLTVGYLRCSHKYFPFMKPLILDIKNPKRFPLLKCLRKEHLTIHNTSVLIPVSLSSKWHCPSSTN